MNLLTMSVSPFFALHMFVTRNIVPCHFECVRRHDTARNAFKRPAGVKERPDVALRISYGLERARNIRSAMRFEYIFKSENVSLPLHDLASVATKHRGELRDSRQQMPNEGNRRIIQHDVSLSHCHGFLLLSVEVFNCQKASFLYIKKRKQSQTLQKAGNTL